MGCDIHAFIEIKERDVWESVSEPYFSRNYGMFGLMAGVRGDSILFKPRGLPKDCGWNVNFQNNLFITTNTTDEHCTTKEMAEQWVACGTSKWADEEHKTVTHPDWHSHSWLTIEEFSKCITHHAKLARANGYEGTAPYYKIALGTMRAAKKLGYEVRLVFWFDN